MIETTELIPVENAQICMKNVRVLRRQCREVISWLERSVAATLLHKHPLYCTPDAAADDDPILQSVRKLSLHPLETLTVLWQTDTAG